MSEELKEWLPNPTFVDYQVPHDGQGADFYDEEKMLEYGRRIIRACVHKMQNDYYGDSLDDICLQIKRDFGVEE